MPTKKATAKMKTPAAWSDWYDAFWEKHHRYPWWHELIEAVQKDAMRSRGQR